MGSSARGQFVRTRNFNFPDTVSDPLGDGCLTLKDMNNVVKKNGSAIDDMLWIHIFVYLDFQTDLLYIWVLVCMHLSTHTQPSVSEESREEHRPWHQDSCCVRGIVLSHSSIHPPTVAAAVFSVPASLAVMPQWLKQRYMCLSCNALLWLFPSPSPDLPSLSPDVSGLWGVFFE